MAVLAVILLMDCRRQNQPEKTVRVLAVISNGDKISPVKIHTSNNTLQSVFG